MPVEVHPGETFRVSVVVRNTGEMAGKEVVQLYIKDVQSTLERPDKELKGFVKVELAPGEEQTIVFELDQRALSYYDPHQSAWVAEEGIFEVLVGASSRDIRLSEVFEFAG